MAIIVAEPVQRVILSSDAAIAIELCRLIKTFKREPSHVQAGDGSRFRIKFSADVSVEI